MSLRVVNIRHKPWCEDPTSYVYCGRPGKGLSGQFGNPYSREAYGDECLELFRDYLRHRAHNDGPFYHALMKLAEQDKPLGCFCVRKDGSGKCHAKIIAAFVEEELAKEAMRHES